MKPGDPLLARTILLVDDDPVSLEIVALLLGADGHRVLQAGGGEYALAMLLSSAAGSSNYPVPDIVLVDMQMPGITGHDIRRYVSSLPAPRPRILGMSATALPEQNTALFDDFLLKPFDFETLRNAISGLPASGIKPISKPAGSALDQEVLHKLQAILPPEAIHEIYSTYITDTRQRIAELEQHSGQDDQEGIRRCAHMIKGSAAMAGVFGIFGIASALEAGTIPKENHHSLFQHLRIACDDVEQIIAYNAPERLR